MFGKFWPIWSFRVIVDNIGILGISGILCNFGQFWTHDYGFSSNFEQVLFEGKFWVLGLLNNFGINYGLSNNFELLGNFDLCVSFEFLCNLEFLHNNDHSLAPLSAAKTGLGLRRFSCNLSNISKRLSSLIVGRPLFGLSLTWSQSQNFVSILLKADCVIIFLSSYFAFNNWETYCWHLLLSHNQYFSSFSFT